MACWTTLATHGICCVLVYFADTRVIRSGPDPSGNETKNKSFSRMRSEGFPFIVGVLSRSAVVKFCREVP